MDTPTVLSLYSGGGGLDLGFRMAVPDARTVCYVERDAASIEVLVTNMQKGRLDEAPIWTDSETFDGKPWRGTVDWIIGGFPCQPWSVAGAQRGTDDERWLWPHIRRIAREVEPRGLFLENVPGLFLGGIQPVLGELAEDGYDAIWTTVRASDVGAPHRRERCFILAYSRHDARSPELGQQRNESPEVTVVERTKSEQLAYSNKPRTENRGSQPSRAVTQQRSGSVGDTNGCGRWEEGDAEQSSGRTDWAELPLWPPGPQDAEGWRTVLAERPDLAPALTEEAAQPPLRGLAHGLDQLGRVDQLRILGNGVVPQQAALAFAILSNQFSPERGSS